VGKLVAGADPLKPLAEAFVDDEAGEVVAAKVQRRLQHFIDRKVAAGFEPLLALKNDETLEGLAKGFAFRMVENFGILPRGDVADDVKALDQDARGALRKHGIRFGQFTIFEQLLLKPAPTRLRLVLWGIAKGLQEFPESPPPGVVTVAAAKGVPPGYFAMAGYRAAGERAIRIDMLERLADMLRDKDSRGGFEANADMLSITGMTLEQFSGLMDGLGYKAEKGEREKVKAVAVDAVAVSEPVAEETPAEVPVEAAPVEEVVAPSDEAPAEVTLEVAETGPEMEVFYTFTWGGRAQKRQQTQAAPRKGGERPRGKPKGRGPKKGNNNPTKPQSFQAKPKREKAIDPDNPFAAALAGFKKD
jgi:ATP-dependent RNA helicase SUPV3L1/SUV3